MSLYINKVLSDIFLSNDFIVKIVTPISILYSNIP